METKTDYLTSSPQFAHPNTTMADYQFVYVSLVSLFGFFLHNLYLELHNKHWTILCKQIKLRMFFSDVCHIIVVDFIATYWSGKFD